MKPSQLPRRFRVVLFDLGSTLIYFDGLWPQVIQKSYLALFHHFIAEGLALEKEFFLKLFSQRVEQYYAERETEYIELTTTQILKGVLSELGHENVQPWLIRQALEEMYAVSQSHWKIELDALPTLQALRAAGYRMGLISNAADDADVQTLIDNTGIRSYFDVILTSAALGIRKPNPRIFFTALERMGASSGEAVMVGDTLGADILGAENAGIYPIWITRRANAPGNNAHLDTIRPQAIIKTLSELPELLAGLPAGSQP